VKLVEKLYINLKTMEEIIFWKAWTCFQFKKRLQNSKYLTICHLMKNIYL